MYKNMTTIEADEMVWNEHDWCLDTKTETSTASCREK